MTRITINVDCDGCGKLITHHEEVVGSGAAQTEPLLQRNLANAVYKALWAACQAGASLTLHTVRCSKCSPPRGATSTV